MIHLGAVTLSKPAPCPWSWFLPLLAAALGVGPALAFIVPQAGMHDHAGQPPDGRSCVACHTDNQGGTTNLNPAGRGLGLLLDIRGHDDAVGTYNLHPAPYTITVTLVNFYQIQGGLQIMALDQQGAQAGIFYLDPQDNWFLRSRIDKANQRQYVHHNAQFGAQPSATVESKAWRVKWYPPQRDVGTVTLYFAAVAGNRAGGPDEPLGAVTPLGDDVYTATRSFTFNEPIADADLDGNGRLDWRDAFLFFSQWKRDLPTPTPNAPGG